MNLPQLNLPQLIIDRRKKTEEKAKAFTQGLSTVGADEIVGDSACVYATGSLGRGEMSDQSDLDLFVLRSKSDAAALTNLNAIRLKARLIETARDQGYPDFSGDGKYIAAHDLREDIIGKLGTNEDDYANVFTARMLLILESSPVVGRPFYDRAIDEVIAVYWRDYEQNSTSFLPAFLLNDILRFWKTLCLNYEERTGDARKDSPGKRRLYNYKLKHSRLLTCYSAVVCLQAILKRDNGTVSPDAVTQMVGWTPTERLEKVATIEPSVATHVETILQKYAMFLKVSDGDKNQLVSDFAKSDFKRERFDEALRFGNAMFELIYNLGRDTDLLRFLVV